MARVHGDPGQTKADKARRKQARINELANLSGIPAVTLRGLREGSLVAVPVEPTMVMLQAVCKADDKAYACGSINGADFETLWAVALDAAKGSQQ